MMIKPIGATAIPVIFRLINGRTMAIAFLMRGMLSQPRYCCGDIRFPNGMFEGN
jgi:hypothetical protein